MINVEKPEFLSPALSRGGSKASYADAVSSRQQAELWRCVKSRTEPGTRLSQTWTYLFK